MSGKYPKIFEHPEIGAKARELFEDGKKLLTTIVGQKKLTAEGVIGIFPANSVGDDTEIYADEERKKVIATIPHLRQQTEQPFSRPNLSLSDFIAPSDSEIPDYIGAFAVTTGIGMSQRSVLRLKRIMTITTALWQRHWQIG